MAAGAVIVDNTAMRLFIDRLKFEAEAGFTAYPITHITSLGGRGLSRVGLFADLNLSGVP